MYTDHLCCGRFLDLSTLLPPPLRTYLGSSSNISRVGNNIVPANASPSYEPSAERPAMDLIYLLEHVMVHENPLDCEAILQSPIKLKVLKLTKRDRYAISSLIIFLLSSIGGRILLGQIAACHFRGFSECRRASACPGSISQCPGYCRTP